MYNILFAAEFLIKTNVQLCGLRPAKVSLHCPGNKPAPGHTIIISFLCPLNCSEHIMRIVALECEAYAVISIINDTVLQTAGGSDYRNRTITCRNHLSKPAGFALGRHKEHIRTCVNSLCKPSIESTIESNLVRIAPVHVLEELLILAFARTENNNLHVRRYNVIEYRTYKIKALMVCKTGYHSKQRYLILRHAELIENSALAGSLTLVILSAEISCDSGVSLRIIHLGVDSVEEAAGLVLLTYKDPIKSMREPRIKDLLCICRRNSGYLICNFDSALHEVDIAVVLDDINFVRRYTNNIFYKIKSVLTLISYIVDRKYMLDIIVAAAGISVEQIIINRNQCALPVVGINDLRLELDILEHFQNCTAEENISLSVVIIAVKTVITLEIELVINKEICNSIDLL